MKILYHHRIASKDGQYVHIEAITRALGDLGHDVVIVGPAIKDTAFGEVSNTVRNLRSWLPGWFGELLEFVYCFFDFFKMCKSIIRFKPDFIYERYNLFLPSGVWAAKIFNTPLLLEINAPLYEERIKHTGLSLKALAKWTERYTWKNADKLLPVTKVLSNIVFANDIPQDRLTVIHNGVTAEQLQATEKSRHLQDKYRLKGKIVLGFVGFIREWHGLENVLDIMSKQNDKNWHFLVVGDGPAKTSLLKKAKDINVAKHLTVTGLVQRDEIFEYLSVFDIALQPDVVAYASPLKLFEYMAAGKAILSIDRANIREILEDNRNCLLYNIDNSNDFADQLVRLYRSQELREKLGKSAHHRITSGNYLWTENAKRIVQIAESLMKDSG